MTTPDEPSPEVPAPVDFEAETRPEGAEGRYTMKVPWGWEGIPGMPYGGWTAAVALRAAGLESTKDRPASLAAQFLRPFTLHDPVTVDVEVVRRGRRTETIEVRMGQRDKVGVLAVVTGVEHADGLEYDPDGLPAPTDPLEMPALGDVIRSRGGRLPDGHHIDHYDNRVPEAREEGVTGADGKEALAGWIRYGAAVAFDDPWVEAARYCVPADTQVPAAFLRVGALHAEPGKLGERPFRATTLDLLLHFHRTERATDWLWHETHVQVAHDGLASGWCNLWSADRHLLATSMSQVAFLPPS